MALTDISTSFGAGGANLSPESTPNLAGVLIEHKAAIEELQDLGGGAAICAAWPIGTTRFFACDKDSGDDSNAGYSDISQAAAGLVAVKTLGKLLSIVPKFGCGRHARVAIKAGDYSGEGRFELTHMGYGQLLIWGTATVPTAGSVAFAGDVNDETCAGMTTATGTNAAGYNAIGLSTDRTLVCQLAGGGAAAFGAAPARPYGCRIRFDVATATAALRNVTSMVINQSGGDTLTLSLGLPAIPDPADVFYVEQPNVIVATTLMEHFGTGTGSAVSQTTVAGLLMATLQIAYCDVTLTGCESNNCQADNSVLTLNSVSIGVGFATRRVGSGLRATTMNATGGALNFLDLATTSTTTANVWANPSKLVWERSGHGSSVFFYGGGTNAGGNNVTSTLGTNSSTVHGNPCQIWGTASVAVAGTTRCGLFVGGDAYVARVACTNMGANPGIRVAGAGIRVALEGTSGSTGNTDVGLDLTSGLAANVLGATGCTIVLVSAGITGTAGDVRLAGGQLVSWAALATTGITDIGGNRIIGGSAPCGVVGKFSGVLTTDAVNPTASYMADPGVDIAPGAAQPQRYPTSARVITRLRVNAINGGGGVGYTVTLYKNGVATTMMVTIAAGAAPLTKGVDLAHPILFADGDDFDLRIDSAGGVVTTRTVSALLEGPV